jgi:hypothetical protein
MKPFDGRKDAADAPHSGASAPASDTAHMKCVSTMLKT